MDDVHYSFIYTCCTPAIFLGGKTVKVYEDK